MTPQSFLPTHPRDHAFFLAFVAMAWIAVLMGFGPEVKASLVGNNVPRPLIVHVHAIVFSGWLALFTAQIWLIRSGQADLHRKLGLGAVVLVPVMVVLGVAATIVSRQAHIQIGQTDMIAYMIVPLTDMILFPSFAVPALLLRKDPSTHKRLMLLAVAVLLPAAFGRWIGPHILAVWGDGFFGMIAQTYLGTNLMILAAMIHDRITRGRVHPVFFLAVPWLLAVETITSAIYHAPGWMKLALWLIGE